MNASVLISVLFLAMILTVIGGLWYYAKKAHHITSSHSASSKLLSSVQQSINDKNEMNKEK